MTTEHADNADNKDCHSLWTAPAALILRPGRTRHWLAVRPYRARLNRRGVDDAHPDPVPRRRTIADIRGLPKVNRRPVMRRAAALTAAIVRDRCRSEQRVMIESLGAACHHISQPMTSVMGNLGLLKESLASDDVVLAANSKPLSNGLTRCEACCTSFTRSERIGRPPIRVTRASSISEPIES